MANAMQIYKNDSGSYRMLKEMPFENEKELQTLIEENMGGIFDGLELLATEFTHKEWRFDSLAFDTEKRCFVIIEYKNIKNRSVSDQGISYYNSLRETPDKFELLYSRIKNQQYETDHFNWDETYVIFISPEYTKTQIGASDSDRLPIKLYQILRYEDGIITLNRINDKSTKDNKKSEKELQPKPSLKLSEYTEEDYLSGKYHKGNSSDETKKLYLKFKEKILVNFPDVESRQTSTYVGFYIRDNDEYICTFDITKFKVNLAYSIKASANILSSSDFVRRMEKKEINGIGQYRSVITNEIDIDKALLYIKKVYDYKVTK